MPLDEVGRRYADTLFAQEVERISREYEGRSGAVRADITRRGLQNSGAYFAALAQEGVRRMEAMAQARADTLLAAYDRAHRPIDDDAVAQIFAEVSGTCEIQSANLSASIHDTAVRTGMTGSIETAIAAEITRESSRIAAQVRRKLVAKRDEAILDARGAPRDGESGQLDDVLGLLTKGQFEKDLAVFTARGSERAPLGLIFIDLDRFKEVNDLHGHPAGDEVLLAAAAALKAACLGKGCCYRYGGDEFAILLPNYTSAEAAALAERMRDAIATLEFKGYPQKMTGSIGVATCPDTSANVGDLVHDADGAMYNAKKAGGNQVRLAPGAAAAARPN